MSYTGRAFARAALDARDKAASLRVAKVHKLDARFIEQRPEQRLLRAKLEPAWLRDCPVVMVRLRDDRDIAQTVWIASTFVRAARFGMDEDRPWLWQCRPASKRAIREEESRVFPDREGL